MKVLWAEESRPCSLDHDLTKQEIRKAVTVFSRQLSIECTDFDQELKPHQISSEILTLTR